MEDVTPELDVERGFHHQDVESVCNASPPPSSASTERPRKWDRGPIECCKTEDYCIGIHAFTQSSSPVISCFAQFHVGRSIGLTGFQKCGFPSDSRRARRQHGPTHVSLPCFRKINCGGCFSAARQLVIYKLSHCETMEIRSVNYTKKAFLECFDKLPRIHTVLAALWISPKSLVHLNQGEFAKSGLNGYKLI